MKTFTLDDFTAAMEKAVADRGNDYVYPQDRPGWSHGLMCVYSTQDGEPACIIGQALYNIDPALMPDFAESTEGEDAGAEYILESRREHFSGSEEDFSLLLRSAHKAQVSQDNGDSWGRALSWYLGSVEDGEF